MHIIFLIEEQLHIFPSTETRPGPIRKYIKKYFPAVFYREHPETIESLASYGSGRMRNLYRVIGIKEELSGRGERGSLGWYKKAEKKSRYRADIIPAACQLEKKLGLISDAQSTCERGCKILPNNELLHLQLARIYRERDQNQKAIAFYKKAISLYEKQLEADWFGKSGVRKSHRLYANLAMAKRELSQLLEQPTLKPFSGIQQKILQVPLINKDIAIRNNEVFFSSNKSGRYELWVWKEDNSLQQLTDDKYVYFHLRPHYTLPRMYFVSDDSGNAKYNMYYRDLNTNEVVRLTDASDNESFEPYELSPDGKNIIYVKESRQDGHEIYQMTHNGRNMRKLTSDRKRKQYLSWHPLSEQFVYVTGEHLLNLFDVNSSVNRTIIKEHLKEIKWPSFSPDGTKIIFARLDRHGYGNIEVFDLNTKKSKVVTMKSGRYLTPQWISRDSILYRENKDDHYLLRITQLNTGETKHIGPPEGVVYDPEITHSGSLLVFLHSDLTTPLFLNRMDF